MITHVIQTVPLHRSSAHHHPHITTQHPSPPFVPTRNLITVIDDPCWIIVMPPISGQVRLGQRIGDMVVCCGRAGAVWGGRRGGRRADGGCGSKGEGTKTGMFVEDGGYPVGGELEFVSGVDGFTSSRRSGRARSITAPPDIQPQGETGSGRC